MLEGFQEEFGVEGAAAGRRVVGPEFRAQGVGLRAAEQDLRGSA